MWRYIPQPLFELRTFLLFDIPANTITAPFIFALEVSIKLPSITTIPSVMMPSTITLPFATSNLPMV